MRIRFSSFECGEGLSGSSSIVAHSVPFWNEWRSFVSDVLPLCSRIQLRRSEGGLQKARLLQSEGGGSRFFGCRVIFSSHGRSSTGNALLSAEPRRLRLKT